MPTNLRWNGPAAEQHVRARALQFLVTLCETAVNRAARILSVPGTGKTKGKRTGPVVHSPPGAPPYKQTGRGRASVTYEIDEQALSCRIGTNVEYMKHQELGTKRGLAPRPWLRPAVDWAIAKVGSLGSFVRSEGNS